MARVKRILKLHIAAGEANPAPPLGPALGEQGINIQEFCVKFNEATRDKKGQVLPVVIRIFEDRTFDFYVKRPLASQLLKSVASIEKGSSEPNKTFVGTISREKLREIAQKKMEDLNAYDLDKAEKIIEGTAKSMGIRIE